MVTKWPLCIASAALIAWLFIGTLPLQAQSLARQSLPVSLPAVQLWHIEFKDQADLNRLAAELDVWEVDSSARRLLAALSAEEAEALSQSHVVTLAPDQSPLAPRIIPASQVNGIPGFACYRTVDETFATLDQLIADYPQLVQAVDIGDSWDKGRTGEPEGDDLRVLVISNQATTGPKFRFFLMSAIHAREYSTAELALRFAEELIQGYGRDANATWLLDHGELHLLTVANPDGRRIAETGILWRKNTNTDAACPVVAPPSSSYGVDLNRNSSFKWNECDGFNCSSSLSCRETYRGTEPASEPEVAAIENYLRTIFADQRGEDIDSAAPLETPGIMISLHSYGRLVLFPWGYTTNHAPNAYGLATLARRFGYPLRYTVCQAGGVGCLYQTDGTTDDFAYGELGVAAFTIELGTAFFQSCEYFEDFILQQGLAALRYAFNVAPMPFVLAEGPELLNVTVNPTTVGEAPVQGTHVAISATADASRITSLSGDAVEAISEPIDRIRTARLTIDALPSSLGSFIYPLTAADGVFNTVQEEVSATIEMACLPTGRHTLYMQAQDEAGDWGVVAAEFVTVTNTSPFTTTIEPSHAGTKDGEAVTYSLQLTNTGTTTASYTLETSSEVEIAVAASLPITLAANTGITLTVVVTPQNITADSTVPAVIIVRSSVEPSQCRQLILTTFVDTWAYRQRLLIIAKH